MHLVAYLESPYTRSWSLAPRHEKRLAEALSGATISACRSDESFLDALSTADIALVWRFEQAWLERAPKLRWLLTPAAGRDYFRIDPPPGLELGYGAFHGELMAETVAGMVLAASRGILLCHRKQLLGEDPWPRRDCDNTMRPLRGARATILGFGSIGQWIGRLLKPFGVRVTGIRRTPETPPPWFEAGDRVVPAEALEAILPETDHLVLALPGGPATDGMMNGRRLDMLPPHAWLYNIGRGNAVDEAALVERLRAGRLGGAGLDVFETEPLPANSPLRTQPNVLLMPHASAMAPNYLDLFIEEFLVRYAEKYGGE